MQHVRALALSDLECACAVQTATAQINAHATPESGTTTTRPQNPPYVHIQPLRNACGCQVADHLTRPTSIRSSGRPDARAAPRVRRPG
jgi:hypothetical protein